LGGYTTPYYRLAEDQSAPNFEPRSEIAPQTSPDEPQIEEKAVSVPQTAQSGNTKWILLLGGLFAFFLVVTAALVGVYFAFFNRTSDAGSISLSNSNKSDTTSSNTSTTQPSPNVSSSSTTSNLPSSITYKSEMVLVSAGEFTMGSDSGDEDSKPAHKVNLPAFYIDKYEVTNAQYKEFCDATGRSYPLNPSWNKNYFLERPNAPVLGVSFNDAKAFAEWTGKRLPTEEEWEKAASWNASSQTKLNFPWGNSFEKDKASFGTNATSDVGKFSSGASPSGAIDMAGNALEWVEAYYQPYSGNSAINPEFGEKNRVARGGFIGSKTNDYLKTTKRTYIPPDFVSDSERDSYVGFRCAIGADDSRIQSFLK
jgi:formylglycine-generating enzyme required for sulfatase activity